MELVYMPLSLLCPKLDLLPAISNFLHVITTGFLLYVHYQVHIVHFSSCTIHILFTQTQGVNRNQQALIDRLMILEALNIMVTWYSLEN